jgi:hypothetical protein
VNDRDFLIWLYERLEKVYGEKPSYGFMRKLYVIIESTSADKVTPISPIAPPKSGATK